ncbi:MAG: hypothetical protein LQ350_003365 [Teloschistes chrysophthalmus]|nr:MAG: hypothetical protein LQ350_003365 [Niorma chrysophthalma]
MAAALSAPHLIDPTRNATIPLKLGQHFTSGDNYKPNLRPNHSTRIRPSGRPSDSRVDLTIDNRDNGTKYQYTGNQQPSGACALIYDPATKTLVLDRIDADFTFNLQSTPTNSNRNAVTSQYPQLDTGLSDLESDDGQTAEAPLAATGVDNAEADANNPYDYRHFLKRQRSSSPEAPPSRPSTSPAMAPVYRPSRPLTTSTTTNAKTTATTTTTTKPKPRPRPSQPRSTTRKIEKIPTPPSDADSDSDGDSSPDDDLVIDLGDEPQKRRRFGHGAVVFNHDRRNGPVSLRSAASSMSPASVRQDSGADESDRDVESLKLGSPEARVPEEGGYGGGEGEGEVEEEEDEDEALVGDLLQAMEGQADDEEEDEEGDGEGVRRMIEESSSESEEE